MPLSVVGAASVAVVVGFGGTLALVVAAARAVGADDAETASWVAATCLAKALAAIWLSLRHRIPIVTAWSTAGAALIAANPGAVDLTHAVGAFLVANLMIVATTAIAPLGRLVARIPAPIAAGMLAGILVRFVIGVFDQAAQAPATVLPLVALFLATRRVNPTLAPLAVLIAGIVLALAMGGGDAPAVASLTPTLPVWTTPAFDPAVLVGLALPLYLVSMASQNLAGFAVLRASGYEPPVASILAVTGGLSVLSAPFGAHATCLGAIMAAICTGPDAHPDPARRWIGGVIYGALYVALAPLAGAAVLVVATLPQAMIATVAGLALAGPLVGALVTATQAPDQRLAAVMTFAVTASGLTFLGVGSAFWGLAIGLAALASERRLPKQS